MNEDKFNLWRATFSLIHIDGKVTTEEANWYKDRLDSLPLSEEQKTTVMGDFMSQRGIEELLDKVTDKGDRAFLLHQVRVVSHIDGHFSAEEKKFFKELEAQIMGNLNLEPLVSQIEEMEREDYREDNVYSVDNEHSFFEVIHKGFLRFINPGDYKFPKK